MKKPAAAFGIVLLMLSIVLLAASGISSEATYLDFTADLGIVETADSWNISRVFAKGDWTKLEITSSLEWEDNLEPAVEDIPYAYKSVWVNITDPAGNESWIECYFVLLSRGAALFLYNLTVLEDGGLRNIIYDIGLPSDRPGIVANTLMDGNYTARVTWMFGGGTAPFSMRFVKGARITEYSSNSYFLYAGLPTFVASVILIIYGFRLGKSVGRKIGLTKKKRTNNVTISGRQ